MKKIVSFSNMPIRIAISEAKCKPLHYHPDVLELLFVLEGRVAISMNQCSSFYEQGEIAALSPGVLHSVHASKVSTLVSIYFDLEHYSELLPYLGCVKFNCTYFQLRREQIPYFMELRNYFIRLMLMYNKNTPSAQAIMRDLAAKVLMLLWLHFQERKSIPEQNLERYYSIAEYLCSHYRDGISVSEVARHENISVTRLAHFWKEVTGLSIRQSITQFRLGEAEKMLLDSSLTINEIAYRCGFSDEKYFYQHFKAHFHITPNEYRIKYLEERTQTVRVLLSKREGERRVAAYAMKYYDSVYSTSLPGLSSEELEKETNLKYLYDAILCNAFTVVRQFASTGQDVGYMQITPGKALLYRGGVYTINWEYVYAQMHIFMDFGLTSHMMVDFDFIDKDTWEELLFAFIEEIRNIWGKNVVEEQIYIIQSKIISMYEQCIELADYLMVKTPVQNAKVVFML